VMCIPKPSKAGYTKAMAYRPISLSSFLLKMMEKLADRHISEGTHKVLNHGLWIYYQYFTQKAKYMITSPYTIIMPQIYSKC
jgi:hypothetical protein